MAKDGESKNIAEDEDDDFERIFIEDEDGISHEYEVVMYLEPDGWEHKYVLLLPLDDADEESDEAEVVPFRYIEEDDELKLFPLESEEEWQMVGETFLALYQEEDSKE